MESNIEVNTVALNRKLFMGTLDSFTVREVSRRNYEMRDRILNSWDRWVLIL